MNRNYFVLFLLSYRPRFSFPGRRTACRPFMNLAQFVVGKNYMSSKK